MKWLMMLFAILLLASSLQAQDSTGIEISTFTMSQFDMEKYRPVILFAGEAGNRYMFISALEPIPVPWYNRGLFQALGGLLATATGIATFWTKIKGLLGK